MSFWHMAYKWGWATKEQLQLAVELREITTDEYKDIIGEEY